MNHKAPIEKPDRLLVAQIIALRTEDPAIRVTDLARLTGRSRKTIYAYLNHLKREAAEDIASGAAQAELAVQAKQAELKAERINGELTVLDKTKEIIADFDQRIAELDKQRNRLKAMPLIIRARAVQERYLRLRAEIEKEIAPPTTSAYVNKIEVLMQNIATASPWEVESDGAAEH